MKSKGIYKALAPNLLSISLATVQNIYTRQWAGSLLIVISCCGAARAAHLMCREALSGFISTDQQRFFVDGTLTQKGEYFRSPSGKVIYKFMGRGSQDGQKLVVFSSETKEVQAIDVRDLAEKQSVVKNKTTIEGKVISTGEKLSSLDGQEELRFSGYTDTQGNFVEVYSFRLNTLILIPKLELRLNFFDKIMQLKSELREIRKDDDESLSLLAYISKRSNRTSREVVEIFEGVLSQVIQHQEFHSHLQVALLVDAMIESGKPFDLVLSKYRQLRETAIARKHPHTDKQIAALANAVLVSGQSTSYIFDKFISMTHVLAKLKIFESKEQAAILTLGAAVNGLSIGRMAILFNERRKSLSRNIPIIPGGAPSELHQSSSVARALFIVNELARTRSLGGRP